MDMKICCLLDKYYEMILILLNFSLTLVATIQEMQYEFFTFKSVCHINLVPTALILTSALINLTETSTKHGILS